VEHISLPSRSRQRRCPRTFALHSVQTNERSRASRAARPAHEQPMDDRQKAIRSMFLNQREYMDLG
jgi:hypothetical protein